MKGKLTTAEVAARYGLSRQRILQLIAQEVIPAEQVRFPGSPGPVYLIPEDTLPEKLTIKPGPKGPRKKEED